MKKVIVKKNDRFYSSEKDSWFIYTGEKFKKCKSPLNILRDKAHQNALDKGFYDGQSNHNIAEKLMLIVSELGEALEALRSNIRSRSKSIPNDLTDNEFKQLFLSTIKDSFEDELADSMIRTLDLCGFLDIDIDHFIKQKMRYNSLRKYKHGKKF